MGVLMTIGEAPDGMQVDVKLVKVEHAVILWPDLPPEPPFYDDCNEAVAVVAAAGGGVVVSKATYESEWFIHAPHV